MTVNRDYSDETGHKIGKVITVGCGVFLESCSSFMVSVDSFSTNSRLLFIFYVSVTLSKISSFSRTNSCAIFTYAVMHDVELN